MRDVIKYANGMFVCFVLWVYGLSIHEDHVCHGKVLNWMLDFVEDFLGGIRLH